MSAISKHYFAVRHLPTGICNVITPFLCEVRTEFLRAGWCNLSSHLHGDPDSIPSQYV
jgi:hypothetical protein